MINNLSKRLVRTLCQSRTLANAIEDRLRAGLKGPIEYLSVIDISGGCGASFGIVVRSPEFNDQSMIMQHRKINQLVNEVTDGKTHAIRIDSGGVLDGTK
ncbi:hypothetical protein ACOME3_001048 [Neoechinorhynchus agilis]